MRLEAVTTPAEQIAVDLLAVPIAPGATALPPAAAALDERLDGLLAALLADGEATGKAAAVAIVRVPPSAGVAARRVALVGRGDADDPRVAAAAVARAAQSVRARSAALVLTDPTPAESRAAAEGAVLGGYRFDRFQKDRDERPPLESFTLVGADPDAAAAGALRAEASNAARDHVTLPSNYCTPTYLAERALALAERYEHLSAQILDRDDAEARGMGAFLGVARGADTPTGEPPKVIVLRYDPPSATSGEHLALVGKAITFDTGGISLKPAKNMGDMKYDMAGGAAVLEAAGLIAALDVPLRVTTVVMATENVPSSRATKPGDILTASNGLTIEVSNTDAEGRLVLADGLVLAQREGATRIVDAATLTGAVVVALGDNYAGAMGSDRAFVADVLAAGEATGERCWELPLGHDYDFLHHSHIADSKNSNDGKAQAGSIHGGAFLAQFVEDGTPWVHVDMAAAAWADRQRGPYAPHLATGFGVRLFTEVAERLADGGGAG